MAVFKATQNKSDSSGKFKATANRSYDSTMVYDWETRNKESLDLLEKYRIKVNNGGYLSADDLAAYQKALDSYVETSESLRRLSKAFNGDANDDDTWYNTLSSLKRNYDSVSKYYSQFASEKEYKDHQIGWLVPDAETNAETVAARKNRYESNASRVEQIKEELPWYGDTILPSFVENIFLNDEQEALKEEMELLESDNLKYQRTQGVLDQYYTPVTEEFKQNSAYRDYTNASKEDLWAYDMSAVEGSTALSNGGYSDEAGNIYDAKGNLIQSATAPEITDKLGMFLSAGEGEITEAYNRLMVTNGNYTDTWANLMQEGDVNGWKHLTDHEIGIYYDLYKREGQEAAYKFLSDMTTELTRRETQATQDYINEAPVLEQIFMNVASIPMSVFGGVTSVVDDAINMVQGEDTNPYSRAHMLQNAASDIRSKTATDINNLTGNVALPFVGTTFGDVYQSIMSFGDSALASVIPGGHVLLGLNAASTEMKDLYERGGSTEQILAGGILAGAAEMFFEKMSIDKLKAIRNMDQKAVKNFTDGFVKAMVMGGVEASEEMATEIANTISDALVMGSQTDWVDMGTFVKNVINAGVGGFISGGLGGAIAAKMNNAQYNEQVSEHGQSIIDQGGVDALQQLALEMSGSNKAIGKLSNNVSTEATAKNVGKLSDLVGETVTAQNLSDITTALEEKGLSKKDAKRVAEYLNKAAQGEYFTEQEAEEAMGNKKIAEVLRDVVTDPKSSINARTLKLINARLGKTAQTPQSQQSEETVSAEGNLTTPEESVSESHYEVSDDGEMVNTKTGDTIEPQGLVQAEDGTYKIAVNDAEPVSNSDVSYANKNQAIVFETFVNLEGKYGKTNKVVASMDLDSRNALLGLYNPEINKDGGIFANGAVSSFFYGHQGIDLSAVPKTSPVWDLTEQQRKIAWNQGRIAGVKATNTAQSNVDTVYEEAQKVLKQEGKTKGSYHAVLEDGITPMSLNESQKAVYRVADDIAQGVQTNIRVYAGTNKAQGFYNHATDEIWLNLNAANMGREAIMAFTLAHELVHRGKKGSPSKYKAFVEFLMKEYGKQGTDVEALIAEQMAAAEEFNKTVPDSKKVNMTREKAFEEVVCDACQRMLLDTNAGQKLAEFGAQSKQNKSFLEDLKRWISEFIEKLRNYFKGVDPDSAAAKEFAKFDDNVKQILADMFVDMSIDAGEKLSTIKAAYGGAFASKFLGLKDIQYNLAAVKTHKDKLQNEYTEDSSTDLKTITARYNKIIDIWTRLGGELNSKFLADWNSKVGKDRTFTIFKAQAGYKYNVELSSMCKKGVPLFEAIDTIVKQEVMKELNLAVLGKAEKEILYDILKQHHFEIPCAICYVEQARQREGVIIDAFLNGKVEKNSKGETTKVKLGWNQVLDSIQKEMKANGVDYSFAQVSRDIATEKYTPAKLDMDMKTQAAFYFALKKIANQEIARYNKAEGKSRKLLADFTGESIKASLGGTLPANLKIFKVLIEDDSSRFKITSDLLYSSMATQNLSRAHNKLYGLFNSQGGVSGYKTKQGTTIYWGDILGKSWKPDTLRNEGGVRNQSNSDFQMYTLLDQAQMYIDFTAKGYYLQAYTKVLSELKLFGLSRGKINASLIPKVVEYRNADGTVDVERTMATAGLDENGNPIYDDIEGINHNEAFMLIEDPEYSKSICGICIGYSDAHIFKLLDDNRVQQIIGFHDKTDDGKKRYKGARYAKNYNGLNEAVNNDGKTVHIGFNPYVKKAEKKFKFNAETETFEGTINYNGKTYTADDIPRLAADLYLEMCAKKEYTPAYADFKDHPNYYKLLADFGLYDSQGHYAPHRKVVYNMPDTVPYLDANGKKQTMNTYDYIKAELVKELTVRDSISEALADTSSEGIIPQFKAAVKKNQEAKSQAEDSQDEKSFSLPKGEPAPTFYSLMARVVDGLKQEKFGASTVVSTLRNKGVKVEEIKWSGIEEFLEGKMSVTKAELQEFIAGSMLQIEEETLDNKARPYTEDQQKRLDEYEAKRAEIAKRLADEWKKITGEEFPVRNPGAGLESTVVNKIIDANKEHKDAAFEGRLLKKLRNDLKKVIEDNDDFGFDSWKDALRSIHRHRRDFINNYEMSTNDKAVIVKYCNALNAYNELPNMISDADTERLRAIARETEPLDRKIMEVKHEYNEEAAKYMTNWEQYSLKGGKNYREMLFRIPGSTYSNEAMFTHWKERPGVLAHARIQDFNTFIGKMLFIEEIQSDWHNAGHKDGYRDPNLEDKHTLSKKMEKYTEEFYASPIADVVRERIAPIGYEGAGVSMILNFLMDSQESMESTLNTLSRKGASFTESEVDEIAKYAREYEEMYHKWEIAPGDLTAPEAPFKNTYHEYVLKRLLRMAAEEGYDSIGWTTAETQDERWQNNLPHKEGTGKSGFLKAYINEYDQRIKKFLSDFGKKWGTTVGKTVLDNSTEVWSMAITDEMKDSVLYDGQVVYSLPKTQNQPYRKPAYDEWDVNDALDDALDHGDQHNDNLIKVGNMPNFITDLIGIEGEFYIYRNHAYENMVSKKDAVEAHRPTVRGGNEIHFHNLGKNRMIDAILSLETPIMTIEDSDEFGNPEIVMILPVRGSNDAPLYAAMSFYADVKINGKFTRKPHVVLTISERGFEAEDGYDGYLEVINKAIQSGKVLSFDKEKMRDYLSVIANHTRVGNITSKSLADNIARFRKFVNDFREKNNIDYKLPIGEDTSPRALLANAFEGIITNDIEKRKIQEYKGNVEMLNAEEQKLHELRAQIKELSFAKGKRDTKKIKELQFDAAHTANRIATLDKMLLRLEAAAPLQNILKREKEMAYKRAEQKGKEDLEAYKKAERERDQQWQSEVKEKYQASKKKAIETREKREAREKLQKLVLDTVKWISYPAKTDVKCPDLLKQPYADFLNGIDMSSKRLADGGDPTKTDLRLANAMGSLATALERVMTSQDPTQETTAVLDTGYLDLPANFVEKLRDMTENVKAMMVEGEYVVNNMTAAEVRQLSQMIRTLNHAIKEVSTLYANLRFANVEALGDNTMSFIDALGEIEKSGGVKDFVQWDNALPYYAFKRFGEGGQSIFEGLMDAQDKLAFLSQQIFNFSEKAWTDKEAREWSEDTHTIDLPNGNTLTLTTADAMSIYCLYRREHALPHLLGGGVRVMGIQKGSQKAKDSRSTLTIEDIDVIISSLTDRPKQVAEAIQEFMSTTCSEWGNEISMKRFLTKEFNEKFYFPIESNDENLPTKDPSAQQSDLFRLLNISATKPLTEGANNEVIIRNIFDVFTNHAADMARLNAYGMALLDYMKWLNYREKTVNDEGQITVRGVRKSMEKAYGKAANSYVLNLVKDVNGRASDNGDPTILMKMMRNAKIASVGANLRVAALQFTSYPRAAMVLSTKSLALGLTKVPQITKAKEYCGIALWKSFGFYDTNIARSIEDQMKGATNIRQKIIELSMKGAEWGDAITWGCLWNACEYEVAQTTKNKVGSEEFYQEVGKKLREVVYATQVVDSTLTRSQLMRSKSGLTQEAASFMSEPTLTANIIMDAGFQFESEKRRTGSIKAAWNKTGKDIGRAVAVYSCVALLAALVESLGDAWRDDDDEEFYKKFFEALPENALLNMLPFNKVPIVSDAFELALSFFDIGFFSSEKMSTQWLSQTATAVDAWGDVLSGKSTATVYGALYKTVKALSSTTGIPFGGAVREVVALWNNTAGAYNSAWKLRTYGQTQEDLRNGLYKAIVSGNKKQEESILAEFSERADDEKDYQSTINSAIRKALRENDPRIKKAAQAVVDGNAAQRANIVREIVAEGNFSLQDIQAAINAEIDKIRKEAEGK